MRMLRRLGNALRLPRGERALLFEAWALFVVVGVALRVISFRRVLAVARVGPPAHHVRPLPPLARVVWLTASAARTASSNPTCLSSALVLWWILRRRGVPATLHIGVARPDGQFAAHAWLEHNGEVIVGAPEHDRYEPLLVADSLRAADRPQTTVGAR